MSVEESPRLVYIKSCPLEPDQIVRVRDMIDSHGWLSEIEITVAPDNPSQSVGKEMVTFRISHEVCMVEFMGGFRDAMSPNVPPSQKS